MKKNVILQSLRLEWNDESKVEINSYSSFYFIQSDRELLSFSNLVCILLFYILLYVTLSCSYCFIMYTILLMFCLKCGKFVYPYIKLQLGNCVTVVDMLTLSRCCFRKYML